MSIFEPFSNEILLFAGAVWLVLLGLLYWLTRGFSKTLALGFVVAGIIAPALIVYGATQVAADYCPERTINAGVSSNGNYRYAIVEQSCQVALGRKFEVRIGLNEDFSTLRTVFRSDDTQRPAAVKQTGEHEFLVLLAAEVPNQTESQPLKPLTVRMDPHTGESEDQYQQRYRDATS